MIVTGFSSCKNNKNNGENKKLKKRSSLKCSCSLPLGGLGWVSPSFGLPSLREGPGVGIRGWVLKLDKNGHGFVTGIQ